MSYDPDALLDRRRLKRRLRIWQGVTLFVVLAGVLTLLQSHGELFRGDRIARLHIEGIIVRDDARSQALAELARDDSIRAVIVHIDSPGGSVVGGRPFAWRQLRSVCAGRCLAGVAESARAAKWLLKTRARATVRGLRPACYSDYGVLRTNKCRWGVACHPHSNQSRAVAPRHPLRPGALSWFVTHAAPDHASNRLYDRDRRRQYTPVTAVHGNRENFVVKPNPSHRNPQGRLPVRAQLQMHEVASVQGISRAHSQ